MNFFKKLFIRSSLNKSDSVIASLKQSFLFLVPIFIIGALSLSLKSFPITFIRVFIKTALNGKILQVLNLIYNATYGFASVYLVIILSYYESKRIKLHKDIRIFSVICSVSCYFGFMGPDIYTNKADVLDYTKMTNIFSALLVAIGCTHVFYFLYNLFFNKNSDNHSTSFERSLRAMIPFLCCVTISVIISLVIDSLLTTGNFNDLVTIVINKPFETMGATFFGGLSVMFVISVLWLFGIHGSNVFDNLLSSATGPFCITNGQIVSKSFIDTFVFMGGCGTSICLLIALILFGKTSKNKKLSKLSFVPVLFNINETLIFGLPVVFNPIYAVPFVITPLVTYTISYFATALGIVPHILNANVHWTTPPIIRGYQATGSVKGSILQIILLIVGVAIYAPFVRLAEKAEQKNVSLGIKYLTNICRKCEAANTPYALNSENTLLKTLENDIASKLDKDIQSGKILLHYQPQVKNEKIVSAEALLRFDFNVTNSDKAPEYLYPPLVIGIAENYGLFDSLSRAVVKQALTDLISIQNTSCPDFHIAVNLRLDLIMQAPFRNWLINQIKSSDVKPYTFGVEITEDSNLSDVDSFAPAFKEIKNAGIEVLMDDFSMGHTSITILQKNYFNYIKIDGNLIKNLDNERSRIIVSSIMNLGKQLNFSAIAEYVETKEQRDILLKMGCNIFQGYLYYKAMPWSNLQDLLHNVNAKNLKK